MPMSEERLAELEQVKPGTELPWQLQMPCYEIVVVSEKPFRYFVTPSGKDAAYIVTACNAFPELKAEVRELQEQLVETDLILAKWREDALRGNREIGRYLRQEKFLRAELDHYKDKWERAEERLANQQEAMTELEGDYGVLNEQVRELVKGLEKAIPCVEYCTKFGMSLGGEPNTYTLMRARAALANLPLSLRNPAYSAPDGEEGGE